MCWPDDGVIRLDDLGDQGLTAGRQDRDFQRRCMNIDSRLVHQPATKPQRIAGIVGIKVNNLQLVDLWSHSHAQPVIDGDQPRGIGGDGGALLDSANADPEDQNQNDEGRQHGAKRVAHLTGLGFGHQHRWVRLPDMRTDRAPHRLPLRANTVTIDAKHGFAVRAGQKHAPSVHSCRRCPRLRYLIAECLQTKERRAKINALAGGLPPSRCFLSCPMWFCATFVLVSDAA